MTHLLCCCMDAYAKSLGAIDDRDAKAMAEKKAKKEAAKAAGGK